MNIYPFDVFFARNARGIYSTRETLSRIKSEFQANRTLDIDSIGGGG